MIPIAKENWRQIGVLLKPQVVDFNALMAAQKAGNYDLASFSTSTLLTTRTTGMGFLQQRS